MTILNGVAALQRATPMSTRVVVGRLARRVVNLRPVFAWDGSSFARSYAAAAAVKSTAAAKKKTATSKSAKTTGKAAKAPAKSKTKAPAKSKTKATAKKPAKRVARVATKTKAKPKPKRKVVKPKIAKPKTRRVLTPAQLEKKEAKEQLALKRKLKEVALFDAPNIRKPTAWNVFYSQNWDREGTMDNKRFTSQSVILHKAFKSLPPAEVQRYEALAEQHKADKVIAYKKWVQSHTPDEIRQANLARRKLKSKFNIPKNTEYRSLEDDRRPKGPVSGWIRFYTSNYATAGVEPGSPVQASIKKLSEQWKKLSPEEKEPWLEAAKADAERYKKEMSITYGIGSRKSVRSA